MYVVGEFPTSVISEALQVSNVNRSQIIQINLADLMSLNNKNVQVCSDSRKTTYILVYLKFRSNFFFEFQVPLKCKF
jgi:hypothetical protein